MCNEHKHFLYLYTIVLYSTKSVESSGIHDYYYVVKVGDVDSHEKGRDSQIMTSVQITKGNNGSLCTETRRYGLQGVPDLV